MTVLYTPEQVAEKFGFKSTVTIFRLYDDGALPGVLLRRGSRKRVVRFREEDLEKFLNARASKQAASK